MTQQQPYGVGTIDISILQVRQSRYREFIEHSQGHTGKFLQLVGYHFHGPKVSYGYSDSPGQVIFLSTGRGSATEWLKMVAEGRPAGENGSCSDWLSGLGEYMYNHFELEFLYL